MLVVSGQPAGVLGQQSRVRVRIAKKMVTPWGQHDSLCDTV